MSQATTQSQPEGTPARRPGIPAHARGGGSDGVGPKIAYLPALDGIRAVSIIGIMANHGGLSWAAGGFFSVNVFFVLSGFLITTLLIKEWMTSATIKLRRFWARRARRLLPALFVLLLGIALYAWLIAPPDTRGSLRIDGLSTLFYVANWHLIFSGQSYFAQFTQSSSPLLHTWTLAIEEQFYLVWPLIVLAVLRWWRSLRALAVVAVAGVLASAIEMAALYHPGTDPSRLYFGTDTRAQDLMVGALLAILLFRRPAASTPTSRTLASGVAVVGAAGFAIEWWMLNGVVPQPDASWFPYHFGFLLADILVAFVIFGVVQAPRGVPSRILGVRPLAAIGKISYGLYLWHWPVDLVVNNARTSLTGYPLFALRFVISVALAALSYHLVEMPVRKGAFRSWRAWAMTPIAVGGTAAIMLVATTGASASVAQVGQTLTKADISAMRKLVNDPGTGPNTPVAAAGAPGPVRALLVGDSEAAFLGFGLGPNANTYGVNFADDGVIGCGLLSGTSQLEGQNESDAYGIRAGRLRVPCSTQLVRWRADLEAFHPDVVLVADGEFEVRNRLIAGQWMHLGEKVVDEKELAVLNQAVQTLHSTGASVVLLTAPYYDEGEQPDGSPWPEDDPARVNIYNNLLHEVAAEHPSYTYVENLNHELDPSGHFQSKIGNVVVRLSDGVHTTVAGAKLISPWLLTQVKDIGEANRALDGVPATAAGSSAAGSSTAGSSTGGAAPGQ